MTFAYAEELPIRYVHTFAVLIPASVRRARTGLMAGHRHWSPVSASAAAIESTYMAITYEDMHISCKEVKLRGLGSFVVYWRPTEVEGQNQRALSITPELVTAPG